MKPGWNRVQCDSNSCAEVLATCEAGACAEVLDADGIVFIRNSKEPKSVVTFDHEEWRHFIRAVVEGEFDL